jgi:hypothetical protein
MDRTPQFAGNGHCRAFGSLQGLLLLSAPNACFSPAVAEIQGLYGAFSFAEKLLQKIWLRGDFNRANAVLSDGRRLKIVHPGKWNLLGGPDFGDARLRFSDTPERETHGDVEVHLRANDWDAHGHARDPAYDQVVIRRTIRWCCTWCCFRRSPAR